MRRMEASWRGMVLRGALLVCVVVSLEAFIVPSQPSRACQHRSTMAIKARVDSNDGGENTPAPFSLPQQLQMWTKGLASSAMALGLLLSNAGASLAADYEVVDKQTVQEQVRRSCTCSCGRKLAC